MNWFRHSLTILCILLVSTIGWGQIDLTLEEMPEAFTYGVYVKMCEGTEASANTITGSGQITIVFPKGQTFTGLTSVSGTWAAIPVVEGPEEAPDQSYVSVGFQFDNPQIVYSSLEPTLLFTFKLEGGPGGLPYLLDNESDPFAQIPNSMGSNPGMEISVIDFGVTPTGIYGYGCEMMDTTTVIIDTSGVDTTIVVIDSTGTGGENPTSTLDEIADEGYFILTPNPTQEWLNVIFDEHAIDEKGQLRLLSASGIGLGELRKEQQEKMTLNVGALPAGIYFLSFESEGRILQRERFLKL